MTSFPVSSSRDSVSRGTSPASASASGSISTSTARPRNDGPPRLNKEFASYRNIFEEIEAHEKNDLSWRLSRGTARQSRHTQAREGGDGVQEALVDEIDVDVDVEDDIVTEGNNERDSAQLRRKPKRVDGLSFTPSYQSEMHNHSNDAGVSTNQTTLKRKRRKIEKSRSDIDRESMRWPISLTELDNYSSEIDDLEESIKIFIGSYIRHNQLQHPYSRSSSNPASASTSASNADADADPNTSEVMVDETFDFGEMDIEQNIPRNLVRNCTEMVRTVLVNLAILRPSDIGRKRKEMGPIDWVGVLGSASMQKDLTP
nr:uncharacterized protein I303_01884 [Kwoniella dejecticola CBS 10117]OBR87676.1 hypothetical protein I303_01884 [Kwoniella dejecticola CBS 10117]